MPPDLRYKGINIVQYTRVKLFKTPIILLYNVIEKETLQYHMPEVHVYRYKLNELAFINLYISKWMKSIKHSTKSSLRYT